jgi:peptidoglycan/xylan/chitin deacetylase (PgdA/CDA1 family)
MIFELQLRSSMLGSAMCVGLSTWFFLCAGQVFGVEKSGQSAGVGAVGVRKEGGREEKVTYSQCHVEGGHVALTFDDGPSVENTPRLLDMLKKRGVKATFFVVGQCAVQHPEIMKRIVAEGHELGNHSWSHPSLVKLGELGVTDQLQRTHDAIQETAGISSRLMRPPYGAFSANQRAWANRKWGYKVILWDVDPLDWKVRDSGRVQAEILKHTVSGSIILAHDIHKSTVDAMPGTLDGLLGKGFHFVTVSELLAMDRPILKGAGEKGEKRDAVGDGGGVPVPSVEAVGTAGTEPGQQRTGSATP